MGQASRYIATIPVLGDLYGDISRSILSVADALTSKGYLAIGKGIQTGTTWGGAPIYGKAQFILSKKDNVTFDTDQAATDLQDAANSIGLKFGVLTDWAVQLVDVTNPGTIVSNAVTGDKKAFDNYQSKVDACKAKGGWFCSLQGYGIPPWVPVVAIGGVGLYVLVQLANVKRAFLGGLGGYSGSRKKGKRRAH